jgi:hypothetical protein
LYSAPPGKFIKKELKEYKEIIKTGRRATDSFQFLTPASIRIFCLGGLCRLIKIIDWPLTFSRYRIAHEVTSANEPRRLFVAAHAEKNQGSRDHAFSDASAGCVPQIAKEVVRAS